MSTISLTEFLRFQVVDQHGANSRLADLIIHELDTDYPLVSHMVVRPQPGKEVVIPWESVQRIDWTAHGIKANDLLRGVEEIPPQAVWLKRDVRDALILDLQSRRITRANDLWFTESHGQLSLTGADTGFQAILRRLTRGWFRHDDSSAIFDWRFVEFLRGHPQAVDAGAGYHRRIIHLPPGEIAYLSTALPYLHAAELLQLLPEQLAADTLEVIPLERQLQIFEELDEQSALQILTHMAPDLAADLVGCIDTQLAHHYLNRLPRRHSEQIVDLLRYPENSVGGIMANDMVSLSPALKVGKARQILRELLKEPDFIYFIYAVDDDPPHRLRGVLSLRQILMADDDQKIADLMNPYLITLSPFDSPDEAGYRLLSSQLAALPVVGAEGQLLGTVTIDAAISQVAPRSWRAQAPRVFS